MVSAAESLQFKYNMASDVIKLYYVIFAGFKVSKPVGQLEIQLVVAQLIQLSELVQPSILLVGFGYGRVGNDYLNVPTK